MRTKFKDLREKIYNYNSKRYKECLESIDKSSIKFYSKNSQYVDTGEEVREDHPIYEEINYHNRAKVDNCDCILAYNYPTKYRYKI